MRESIYEEERTARVERGFDKEGFDMLILIFGKPSFGREIWFLRVFFFFCFLLFLYTSVGSLSINHSFMFPACMEGMEGITSGEAADTTQYKNWSDVMKDYVNNDFVHGQPGGSYIFNDVLQEAIDYKDLGVSHLIFESMPSEPAVFGNLVNNAIPPNSKVEVEFNITVSYAYNERIEHYDIMRITEAGERNTFFVRMFGGENMPFLYIFLISILMVVIVMVIRHSKRKNERKKKEEESRENRGDEDVETKNGADKRKDKDKMGKKKKRVS